MALHLKIKNTSRHPLPQYHSAHAAAFDVSANLDAPVVLGSLDRALIPTGLYIAMPPGYEAQVRPRSGLAFKHGLSIVNAPGTIDADYRGEWGVILINLGREPFTVNDGDRIAQIVIAPAERIEWEEVTELEATDRGAGGFGGTGA